MAKLDSLIVDLQLNTAELRKGLDDANQKLEGFGKKLNDLAGVVVFEKMAKMAGHAVKGLAEFALKGAEAADRAGKMAQAVGMSVESFSRLAYAGELSGVSAEELGTALTKLSKNMSEAATGSKEQVALFGALGVKVTDAGGKVRAVGAVMGDLATKFSGMADGASKATLSGGLFGDSLGRKMIPMMKDGAAGLAELAKESDRLGITITTGAAAAAEEFNDNLAKLKLAAQAVGQQAAAELTPALAALTGQLLEGDEGAQTLRTAAQVLATALKLLASAGIIVGAVFDAAGTSIARAASAAFSFARGDFSGAVADAFALFQKTDVTAAADSAIKKLGALWGEAEEAPKKAAKATGKSADEIAAALERMKKAAQEAESATKALEKVALDYEGKVAGFGAGPLEELEGRLDKGDLAAELAKIGDKAAAMRDRIMEAATELQNLKEGKLNVELEFARERTMAATSASIRDRRDQNMLGPGATSLQRAQFDTRGFESFEQALEQLAKQTNENAKRLGDAEMLKLQGDIEGAAQALRAADEAGRAADAASKAADAFVDVAKETLAKQKEITNMALGVLSSIGEHGAEISQLANSAMQGFEAGGIWGAIIAVIANLFAKLASVGQFIDKLFGDFMAAFEQLDGAFSVLFASLTQSLAPVMKGLKMVFGFISEVLTPIFAAMENVMAPFEMLADSLLEMLDSTGILGFVIKAVSFVFNAISVVVLAIIYGIQWLWAGVLGIVRGVIAFFTLGQGTAEIDKTIATHQANMAATKEKIDRVSGNMLDPRAATDTQPEHGAEPVGGVTVTRPLNALGDAAGKAGDALNKFAASLTNVPEGFKYKLRAFEAMDAVSGVSMVGNLRDQVTIHVAGSILSEDELFGLMENWRQRKNFRSSGMPIIGNTRG